MSLVKYNTNLSPLLGDFFDIFDAFDPITRPVSNVSSPKAFVDSQEGQHVTSAFRNPLLVLGTFRRT